MRNLAGRQFDDDWRHLSGHNEPDHSSFARGSTGPHGPLRTRQDFDDKPQNSRFQARQVLFFAICQHRVADHADLGFVFHHRHFVVLDCGRGLSHNFLPLAT